MRIAILSPVAWRTPPRHYGPWEQVASNIAEGLVMQGHDVTLFATADSLTKGKLDAVVKKGYGEDNDQDAKVLECLHISNLMEKSSNFDLIHNNFDFLPLTYSRLIKTPFLTTIHGFSSEKILPVYKKYNQSTQYVSISNSNRSPELDYIATVYNGLNVCDFDFNNSPEDYLLFLGRIHRDKGASEAIQIAIKSNKRLIMAGLIQDTHYFNELIKPFLNEQIQFIGNVGPSQRNKLLGNALALLHPINFKEPFGMSVAESMLCGTPVIAFNKGSMPELIDDGKSGVLVNSIDEAAEAVKTIFHIDRLYCHNWAKSKFSTEKMVTDYIRVYQKIIST
ncbi:glycosyltransferase family 4 protein [Arcticibacter eurypsychrophilus]|uniref:glycosyltransferase family 4 protein n=1 Tax=Arcticibacter eurypsychrophilus TaxID=1434752 RepID=UPI00084D4A1C|nr:glycosyltransferase family 4 protein [Arcticibacter eurypsychrophilus]